MKRNHLKPVQVIVRSAWRGLAYGTEIALAYSRLLNKVGKALLYPKAWTTVFCRLFILTYSAYHAGTLSKS